MRQIACCQEPFEKKNLKTFFDTRLRLFSDKTWQAETFYQTTNLDPPGDFPEALNSRTVQHCEEFKPMKFLVEHYEYLSTNNNLIYIVYFSMYPTLFERVLAPQAQRVRPH